MIALAAFDMRAAVALLVALSALFTGLMMSSRVDDGGDEEPDEDDDRSRAT